MNRRTLIGAAVAAVSFVALVCVLRPTGEPQGGLQTLASQALAAANLPADGLSFTGSDATLRGPEAARSELERARAIVAGVPGVASARILTTTASVGAAPPPAAASPARAANAAPTRAPALPSSAALPTPQSAKLDSAASRAGLERSLAELLKGRIIEFEASGTALDRESEALLGRVAELLKSHPQARIRVEGHTDARGDAASNLALSLARAEAVVRKLQRLGVSAERLHPLGIGETRPTATNATEAGRRANRRVEIHVQGS